MKNLQVFTAILINIFLCCMVSAQCPQGNVTLTTQQEVNDFAANYPTCTALNSNLIIGVSSGTSNIADLTPLGQINSISGVLILERNDSLINLNGMENLNTIIGLTIIENDALTSLSGLDNLTSGGGFIQIRDNASLLSLTALQNATFSAKCVFIENNDALINLNGLQKLTVVDGLCGVFIEDNDALTSLSGLDNLTSVDEHFQIINNNSLTDLTGLGNLTTVIKTFEISDNAALTSLNGLDNLTTINRTLILKNNSLTDISALENLVNLGSLHIKDNTTLTNLNGLENLTVIRNGCHIENNDELTDLNGLRNVTSIGLESFQISIDGFKLSENDALTDLTGFENLTTVGDRLTITENHILNNIDNLNIDYQDITHLTITNNDSLANCSIGSICEYIYLDGGIITIGNNKDGCNNADEVLYNCTPEDTCLGASFTFSTQASIDDFAINYPDCSELESLSIEGSDISNLNGLSQITTINGNLTITETNIKHLFGLENLTTIDGNLNITHNILLNDINGLNSIDGQEISGLEISNNNELAVCSIESICSYLFINTSYTIQNNKVGCNNATEVLSNCVLASSCSGTSFVFETQAAINSFAFGYPNCFELENLTIQGSDILDLNGLSQITTITGDLNIAETNIQSLSGLENLTAIYGNLNVGRFKSIGNGWGQHQVHTGNDSLVNLSGLDSLHTVGGNLIISGNRELNTLTGLNNLENIGGALRFYNNPSLINLTGLERLHTISGELKIGYIETNIGEDWGDYPILLSSYSGNYGLQTLQGLESLTAIGGDLSIMDNTLLSSFSGLTNLESIGGSFNFYANGLATDFTGLEKLRSVSGDFNLSGEFMDCDWMYSGIQFVCENYSLGNSGLVNFSGLDSLQSIGGNLRIEKNSALQNFSGAENLISIGGNLMIKDNNSLIDFSGLDNLNYINANIYIEHNGLNTLEGLTGIGTINGNVEIIDNDNLSNLNGLNNLTAIDGNIKIIGNNLNSFVGLSSLTVCNADVEIGDNYNLPDMNGLEGITTIGGHLKIYNNNNLNSLSGLDNLTSIIGNLELGNRRELSSFPEPDCWPQWGYNYWVDYGGNAALTNISALSNLNHIGGSLAITGNDALSNLVGLEGIDTINGSFTVLRNQNLSDFSGLNNLNTISGSLIVGRIITFVGSDPTLCNPDNRYFNFDEGYNGIVSFNGLNNLQFIGGNLTIAKNYSLSSLSGLDNLQTIGGSFYFYDNPQIPDLTGLNSLTSIDGGIELFHLRQTGISWQAQEEYLGNESLQSLNGLNNLNTISGPIRIINNDSLTNLLALESLDYTGITSLKLTDNDNLSVCNATAICSYLESEGAAVIMDNAIGCSSDIEIESACVVSVDFPDDTYTITIYPNPNTGIFQVNGIPEGTYIIHDATGRIIQNDNMKNDLFIDISQEIQGVYFMSIQIDNEVLTKRIIKM